MALNYVKHEEISLKNHPDFDEPWLQEQIRNDPKILGLGELAVISIERYQPKAGRLDILLRDPESNMRYEVELMLGTVDESHIIRCIEYWDIERKRYPQFDHCAVLVAETITTRFLNVIGLFNSAIPLIAIQLKALKVGENIVLNFVKVLDIVSPGEPDEEMESDEPTDRPYWEKRASRETLQLTDKCIELLQKIDQGLNPTYRMYYIGISDRNRVNNFVLFSPKKKFVKILARVADIDSWAEKVQAAGLDVIQSKLKYGRLGFSITSADYAEHESLISDILKTAYDEQID